MDAGTEPTKILIGLCTFCGSDVEVSDGVLVEHKRHTTIGNRQMIHCEGSKRPGTHLFWSTVTK